MRVCDRSWSSTALLAGPVGCGKTVAVYALAQQLGYKVTHCLGRFINAC